MLRLLAAPILLSLFLASCHERTQVEQANEEGILILGNSNEPKGLDPHLVTGVLESNILQALFEGLCSLHPSEDGTALPGAAECWEANDDFTEWTFHLRPDGVWSDGEPLTAHDFAFAYERILTPKLAAKYASMLYFLDGAEAFNRGETDDFSTVGVEVVDDHTLHLRMRGPIPFLPEITKHYTWFPVPEHAVLRHGDMADRFTDWTKPGNLISNGPFTLKSWRVTHHIEVEKNPRYWDADTVTLQGVRFLPIGNTYTETRMFLDGQLHATYTLPAEMIGYARERMPEMLRQEPYVGTNFLRCNTARPPLDKPGVRRALALAIDRRALIDSVLQGGQEPATGITPPFGGYEPPGDIAFDPGKARELLAASGYESARGLPEIELLTTDRDTSRRIAEALQAMWKQHLGLEVRIIQREWTTYLRQQQEMDYDLASGGWIGDYLDPTTFLELWRKGDGNNNTGWSSQEFEDLLKKAELTTDPAERYRVLAQAERVIVGETPIIPIYWYTTNYLLRPEVKNWNPLLLNHHPYKFIRLEP